MNYEHDTNVKMMNCDILKQRFLPKIKYIFILNETKYTFMYIGAKARNENEKIYNNAIKLPVQHKTMLTGKLQYNLPFKHLHDDSR